MLIYNQLQTVTQCNKDWVCQNTVNFKRKAFIMCLFILHCISLFKVTIYQTTNGCWCCMLIDKGVVLSRPDGSRWTLITTIRDSAFDFDSQKSHLCASLPSNSHWIKMANIMPAKHQHACIITVSMLAYIFFYDDWSYAKDNTLHMFSNYSPLQHCAFKQSM